MPAWSLAFGGTLTDEQIRQIATYLRSLEAERAERARLAQGQRLSLAAGPPRQPGQRGRRGSGVATPEDLRLCRHPGRGLTMSTEDEGGPIGAWIARRVVSERACRPRPRPPAGAPPWCCRLPVELAARRSARRQRRHHLHGRLGDRGRSCHDSHCGDRDRRHRRTGGRGGVDGPRRVRLGEHPTRLRTCPHQQGTWRAGAAPERRARGARRPAAASADSATTPPPAQRTS